MRRRLVRACELSDMSVVEAATGADGLRVLFDERPSIVTLDAGLEDLSGWVVLERMRALCDVPVVMLHDAYDELAVVRALRAGADDVLTAPFGAAELIARIEALLRRGGGDDQHEAHCYVDGAVEIDLQAAEARVDGRTLQLTPLELRLLWEFVLHPRQTLSPEHLLERVWGEDTEGRDRVKIYVGYLRAKFREQGAEAPIVTARGFGYRYEPPA